MVALLTGMRKVAVDVECRNTGTAGQQLVAADTLIESFVVSGFRLRSFHSSCRARRFTRVRPNSDPLKPFRICGRSFPVPAKKTWEPHILQRFFFYHIGGQPSGINAMENL